MGTSAVLAAMPNDFCISNGNAPHVVELVARLLREQIKPNGFDGLSRQYSEVITIYGPAEIDSIFFRIDLEKKFSGLAIQKQGWIETFGVDIRCGGENPSYDVSLEVRQIPRKT